MRRDRGQIDYVNLWFQWRVFGLVARVAGALGFGLVLVGWFVVYEIAPQYGVPYLEIVFGGIVLAIPVLIVVGLYQAFRKRPDPLKGWAPPGAIANPPGDFFDDQGRRLWERTGDRWVRLEVPRYEK